MFAPCHLQLLKINLKHSVSKPSTLTFIPRTVLQRGELRAWGDELGHHGGCGDAKAKRKPGLLALC